MTDRELLELAAKAAGIKAVWLESSYYGPTMARVEVKSGEEEITEPWNPLTDDGDALRLVVKLKMAINITPSKIFAGDGITGYTETMDTSDPYAATRRAIVRAAAEIGRNME